MVNQFKDFIFLELVMQLTSLENLNDNIKFKEPKSFKVKDSNLKYQRIPIEVTYPNNKKGPLVIETPFLFSFGVTERRNQDSKKLVGYSIPVCLWSKDEEPNKKEREFYEAINNLTSLAQQYLESDFGPDAASHLTDPLYYKEEEYTDKKGKKKTRKSKSAAPVLYAKLIYSERSKKILSLFKDNKGKDLNPFKYLDQYFTVKLALIVEGIFMSKSVTSLQIKVHECRIKPLKPRESLLPFDDDEEDEEEEVKDYDYSSEEEDAKELKELEEALIE